MHEEADVFSLEMSAKYLFHAELACDFYLLDRFQFCALAFATSDCQKHFLSVHVFVFCFSLYRLLFRAVICGCNLYSVGKCIFSCKLVRHFVTSQWCRPEFLVFKFERRVGQKKNAAVLKPSRLRRIG